MKNLHLRISDDYYFAFQRIKSQLFKVTNKEAMESILEIASWYLDMKDQGYLDDMPSLDDSGRHGRELVHQQASEMSG